MTRSALSKASIGNMSRRGMAAELFASFLAASTATTGIGNRGRGAEATDMALTIPPHMPMQCTLPSKPIMKIGMRLIPFMRAPLSNRFRITQGRRLAVFRVQVAVEHHADIADQQAAFRRHGQPFFINAQQSVHFHYSQLLHLACEIVLEGNLKVKLDR